MLIPISKNKNKILMRRIVPLTDCQYIVKFNFHPNLKSNCHQKIEVKFRVEQKEIFQTLRFKRSIEFFLINLLRQNSKFK